MYRDWNMGRESAIRKPQRTDDPNDFLEESFANLAVVLNNMKYGSEFKTIDDLLARFYPMYGEVHVMIDSGTAQLWIREQGLETSIPSTRLSDGTLRFLSLLTVLCHPKPPPLICIEEPELGLHPEVVALIAELLKSASKRTQLIVTTHSRDLVNALSDQPESVVVCGRGEDYGTDFRRLSQDRLNSWLEDYQLGELWAAGEIGGTRW
jgi:predicted ATPase